MAKNAYSNTNRLLRAGRKYRNLTQTEVAKHIGVDQSAYSRMEKGLQNIYIEQWLMFCELAGIPVDSAQYGCIDFLTPVTISHEKNEGGFKIAKDFSRFRATSNRNTALLLEYAAHCLGPEKLDEFLESKKLDRDFFLLTGSTLNIDFELNLLKTLIQKSDYSKNDLVNIPKALSKNQIHGRLGNNYLKDQNPLSNIRRFVENVEFYEKNFSWKILEENSHQVVLSVTPEEHLGESKFTSDPILQDHYCRYQRLLLENTTSHTQTKPVSIVEKECLYKSTVFRRCVYQVAQ